MCVCVHACACVGAGGRGLWGNSVVCGTTRGGGGNTEHAFQGDEALALRLGTFLWPALASDYIQQRLATLPLHQDTHLQPFEAGALAARKFEEAAASLG
jgi:hypothetical protein